MIRERLEEERKELLDLSTRTRLLNVPRRLTRVKTVEVIDELADEVFRILVQEKAPMSFLPAKEEAVRASLEGVELSPEQYSWLAQPDEDDALSGDVARRHLDNRLQTKLSSEQLQKRLLAIHYDARTVEEEQGVNILYLAIGFLKWYEDPSSDKPRHAPLILVPVSLARESAKSKFKITYSGEDFATNLTLQARLHALDVAVPDLPEIDDLRPSEYIAKVATAVQTVPRWEVIQDDMLLGMFSFAKLLMYRDLDPEKWPPHSPIEQHTNIAGLLSDGFGDEAPMFADGTNLDEILDPKDQFHVVDADASQALVIEEVRDGRNLVIQGPPGTGKSQTITNLIASAVKDGKRVLFVAEKRAALEVVHRRMSNIGLGELCLELHSHKARKKAVLEELRHVLELGAPSVEYENTREDLRTARARLNKHAHDVNEPVGAAKITPYEAIGQLVQLRSDGIQTPPFQLAESRHWTSEETTFRRHVIEELAAVGEALGIPGNHSWRGVSVDTLLPADVDRLHIALADLQPRLEAFLRNAQEFGALVGRQPLIGEDVGGLLAIAALVLSSPPLDRGAFTHEAWTTKRGAINELVSSGVKYSESERKLSNVVIPAAWNTDCSLARRVLASVGRSWWRFFNGEYRAARRQLKGILQGPPPKAVTAQLYILDTIAAGQAAREQVVAHDDIGAAAFGSFWSSANSNWDALSLIDHWESEHRDGAHFVELHEAVGRCQNKNAWEGLCDELQRDQSILDEVDRRLATICLEWDEAFGVDRLQAVDFTALTKRFGEWIDTPRRAKMSPRSQRRVGHPNPQHRPGLAVRFKPYLGHPHGHHAPRADHVPQFGIPPVLDEPPATLRPEARRRLE